jgi:hypothetical protein
MLALSRAALLLIFDRQKVTRDLGHLNKWQ